ncbi:MAG: hypothetical protein K2H24_05800, partial [Clostridia bacterium]|nr:hypothetical protein [Clostridia bacterium]
RIKELEEKVNALKQERLAALYEQQQAQEQEVENEITVDSENNSAQESAETTQEETPSAKEVEVENVDKKNAQVAPQREPQKTQTYINPDMVRRGNRDNNRPPFDKNRPAGGQQRPVGQGGARPFAPKGRVEVVAPTLVNNKTDNKKKKDVKTTFSKDEKKGMSKRDLLKRGYAYDSTLEDDSDTARYVKVKKSKKDLN